MQQAMGVCQKRYYTFLNGRLSIPMMCPTSGSYPYGERLFTISSRRFEGGPKLLNICYKDDDNKKHSITHYDIKNLYYDTADFSMRIYPHADETFTIPVYFRVELNGIDKIGGSLSYTDLNIGSDEDVVNFTSQFSMYREKTPFISHIIDTMLERCREKLLNAIAREIQEECTQYDTAANTIYNIRNMLEYDGIRLIVDRDDTTGRIEKYIVTFLYNHSEGVQPFRKVRELDTFSMIYRGIPVTVYYTYCSRNYTYNKCYKTYPGFHIPYEELILDDYDRFNQRVLYVNGNVEYMHEPEIPVIPNLGITIPSENNFVNYGSYTVPTVPVASFNTMNELQAVNMPTIEYMNNMNNYSRGVVNIPSVPVNIGHVPVRVIYNNDRGNNNNNEVIGPRRRVAPVAVNNNSNNNEVIGPRRRVAPRRGGVNRRLNKTIKNNKK